MDVKWAEKEVGDKTKRLFRISRILRFRVCFPLVPMTTELLYFIVYILSAKTNTQQPASTSVEHREAAANRFNYTNDTTFLLSRPAFSCI